MLEAVGTEDASDGEFCETSNETVPVGKSSTNETEADLPKLPEKLMGAPDANAAEKMPSVQLRPRHIAIVFRWIFNC